MSRILTESDQFTPEQIERICDHYSAKYVFETCIKGKGGGWVNLPVAVFYQEDETKVPPGGSQWFGLYYKAAPSTRLTQKLPQPDLMITNAISALAPFKGIRAKNGDIIYSRYRHDMRSSPDGSVSIDGGRDYLRYSGDGDIVDLYVLRDRVYVI